MVVMMCQTDRNFGTSDFGVKIYHRIIKALRHLQVNLIGRLHSSMHKSSCSVFLYLTRSLSKKNPKHRCLNHQSTTECPSFWDSVCWNAHLHPQLYLHFSIWVNQEDAQPKQRVARQVIETGCVVIFQVGEGITTAGFHWSHLWLLHNITVAWTFKMFITFQLKFQCAALKVSALCEITGILHQSFVHLSAVQAAQLTAKTWFCLIDLLFFTSELFLERLAVIALHSCGFCRVSLASPLITNQ